MNEPLIKINTAEQIDFVRYLFAKRKVKELQEEILLLEKQLVFKDNTINFYKGENLKLSRILESKYPKYGLLQNYKKQVKELYKILETKNAKLKELNKLNLKLINEKEIIFKR